MLLAVWIELAAGERQRLGVAFVEVNAQAFRGGARAGLGDEIACDVNAADHAAAARGDNREIPRAACHVEHARAWLEGLSSHEFLGDVFD